MGQTLRCRPVKGKRGQTVKSTPQSANSESRRDEWRKISVDLPRAGVPARESTHPDATQRRVRRVLCQIDRIARVQWHNPAPSGQGECGRASVLLWSLQRRSPPVGHSRCLQPSVEGQVHEVGSQQAIPFCVVGSVCMLPMFPASCASQNTVQIDPAPVTHPHTPTTTSV